MRKKCMLIMLGLLFGLCGMFFNLPAFLQTHASSVTASVWDGQFPQNAEELKPGEFYFDQSDNAYHINSASAFAYFAYRVNRGLNSFSNSDVLLEVDVDLASLAWTPIGSSSHEFAGTFDGQGHFVYNVNLKGSSDYEGLFGYATGSSIKNLNIRNFSYSGSSSRVGAVVAFAGCEIENCSVKGKIDANSNSVAYIGGMVGQISGHSITNCMADVSVVGQFNAGTYVGGLAGQANNCNLDFDFSSGDISISSRYDCYVGGLVGRMAGTQYVHNVYNVGQINCENQSRGNIGGLVGRIEDASSEFKFAYNAAEMIFSASEGMYVGGLIGFSSNANSLALENLIMIGNMSKQSGTEISPLFNVGQNVQIKDVYFDASLPGGDRSYAFENLSIFARTRDFYRNYDFFESIWNFPNNDVEKGWKMGSGNDNLPFFNFTAGQVVWTANNDEDTSGERIFSGLGTAASPYLIETAGDLALLSQLYADGSEFDQANPYFSLQNDINLFGKNWNPIGTGKKVFSGIFDGNGHTISNLTSLNYEKFAFQGLFGRTSEAVIKNLIVENFNFAEGTTSTANLVASVAGRTYVVNCQDKNQNTKNTVGQIEDGALYVAFGKNNLGDAEIGGSDETLKLSGISYIKGFDVALFGEGGNFYSKNADIQNMLKGIYLGEFHVLLNENGQVLLQNIDETFGMTALPGLSTGLGKNDVLMWKGHKLKGYKLSSDDSNSLVYTVSSYSSHWSRSFSEICSKAIEGLSAVWDEGDGQKIRVIYNSYELQNFSASKDADANYVGQNLLTSDGRQLTNFKNENFVISRNSSGQIYIDFLLEYDSVLSESNFIFDMPYFSAGDAVLGLRNDFEMTGIYHQNGALFNKNDADQILVNELLNSTYYAHWTGMEEEKYTIKLVFQNQANDPRFDFEKAIEETSMTGFMGRDDLNPKQFSSSEEIASDGTYVVSFQYNTLYSDDVADFLAFKVALGGGFELARSGISIDENDGKLDLSMVDTNFGMTTATKSSSVVQNFKNVAIIDDFNNLKFFNLRGNHEFKFSIQREEYVDQVEISNQDIVVGVGPTNKLTITGSADNFSSNVTIAASASSQFVDLLEFAHATDEWTAKLQAACQERDVYLAFDLSKQRLVLSTTNYDSLMLDQLSNYTNPQTGEINFVIKIINGEKQTTYSFNLKNRQERDPSAPTSITEFKDLILKNVSDNVEEVKFSYNMSDTTQSYISYKSFSFFTIMFSTEFENSEETESISFTDVGARDYYLHDQDNTFEDVNLRFFGNSETGNVTKNYVAFKDIYHEFRDENNQPKLTAIMEYVKASFNFYFDHENFLDQEETGMFVNGTNQAPELKFISKKEVDIIEPGEIDVFFQQTDFFRFFDDRGGSTSAKLYSEGKNPLHPSTADSFNIQIKVVESTLKGEKAQNTQFAEDLNGTNGLYFSVGTYKKINKGQAVNFETGDVQEYVDSEHVLFDHDGYHIKLKYNMPDHLLKSGRYEVTFICTDQLYEVQFDTKVVSQEDVQEGEQALEDLISDFKDSTAYDEEGSLISTQVSNRGYSVGSDSGKLENIKFNERLSLSSQTTTNHGYMFYRWIVRSEEPNALYLAEDQRQPNRIFEASNFENTLEELYQKTDKPAEKYILHAFAVYQRKQVTVSLYSGAYIENELTNGFNVGQKGLEFSMQDMSYVFGIEKNPDDVIVSMSGDNAKAYYLDGYKVFDQNGNELLDDGLPIYEKYSLADDETATPTRIIIKMNWIKDAIRDAKIMEESLDETFYVVPTIRRKNVELKFHSGTGNEKYGDGLNGHVFSVTNNETTSLEYDFADDLLLRYGEYVDLSKLVPQGQNSVIEDLFHHRTGYSLPENSWAWQVIFDNLKPNSGIFPKSMMFLSTQFFDESTYVSQIHIYRIWNANTYEIIFNSNTGTFSNSKFDEEISLEVEYDQTYSDQAFKSMLAESNILPIAKSGYTLTGWTLLQSGGQNIFERDGTFSEGANAYFDNRKYINPNSFRIYAQWQVNSYDIEILFNKADSVNGKNGETKAKFSLAYNSKFSDLNIGNGLVGIESFTNENVLRAGFIFDGIFAVSDGQKVKIDNSFVFNEKFPSFAIPRDGDVALTLYVGWRFDENYFDLSAKNSLAALTYNMQQQTVSLSQYFTEGNFAAKGFQVALSGEELVSLSSEVKTIDLSSQLVNSAKEGFLSAQIDDKNSFKVRNVGKYAVTLLITLKDMMTDNSTLNSNFNLGELKKISLTFMISVEKATIDITGNFNDGLRLQNLKRLVGVYLPTGKDGGTNLRQRLYDASTLSAATAILQEFDASISGKSDEEVYQYMMTRFYLLSHINETTSENQRKVTTYYKNWTFEDFEAYKTQNFEEFEKILTQTNFFGFYDFQHETNSYELLAYSPIGKGSSYGQFVSLHADNDFEPIELAVSSIEIFTPSSVLQPRTSYLLKIYVNAKVSSSAQTILDNYNLQSDSKGAYFIARSNNGYVMPQILSIENVSPDKQVYFSRWYQNSRSVPWAMEGDAVEIDGKEYYYYGNLNGQELYLSVAINTSNVGKFEQDTTYRYTNFENFLYFSNVSMRLKNGETYRDVTKNFKFVLDDSNFFIIKSTKSVARIQVQAKYYTMNDNIYEISDLPEEIANSVLAFTNVELENGETFTNQMLDRNGSYEFEGELMFQISSNHANQIEIFVGSAVQNVTFATSSLNISNFISLLKWSSDENEKIEINGQMERHDSFSVTKEMIMQQSQDASDEVVLMKYEAIFTDLVKITYDYNFPPQYQGETRFDSVLKLGQQITDEIFPYEQGLGKAKNVYVRNEDKTEVEYTALNNTLVGETKVFGGWNSSGKEVVNKFAPITLSVKWALPDTINYERIFDDEEQLSVYSYSAFNLSDFVWIAETNEKFFEYSYKWEVQFDDGSAKQESVGQSIVLKNRGGVSASGTYNLSILIKVHDYFIKSGTFEDVTYPEIVITSHIQFMPYKLTKVQAPGDLTVEYDGRDHCGDFQVDLEYVMFDNATNAYGENPVSYQAKYATTELFVFTIKNGDNSVSSMVDVGEYDVSMSIMEDMFVFADGLPTSIQFKFSITPAVIDLSEQTFSAQKHFNEPDPQLEKVIQISGEASVTIVLTRDDDEDVGLKELFLKDVELKNKNNVKLVYNGETIFENGEVLGHTSIGSLLITASGTLQIELQGESLENKRVTSTYTGSEYTLEVNEFNLLIKNDKLAKDISLGLSLYDATVGENLDSNEQILAYLRDKMSTLKAYFFDSKIVQAIEGGTYTYMFDVSGTPLSAYYSNVAISSAYKFVIATEEISLSGMNFDKVYDGTRTKIFDISGRDDIQLRVTYASQFVSEKVAISKVDILAKEGSSVNVRNLSVTDIPNYAKISKLEATLTLQLKNDEEGKYGDGKYEYGILSENSLSRFFIISKIEYQNGNDLSLLVNGRYSISYQLSDQTKKTRTNANGFLFMGQYSISQKSENDDADIQVIGNFEDFEMTLKFEKAQEGIAQEISQIEVTQRVEKLTIQDNLKIITTHTQIAEYYELEFPYMASGDVLILRLVVVGHSAGETLAAENYAFALQDQFEYAEEIGNSIKVEIQNPENKGLLVVEQENTVFVSIENDDDLQEVYDGSYYSITTQKDQKTFTISNGAGKSKVFNYNLTSDQEDDVDIDFSVNFESLDSVSKVGTYVLVLKANTSGYNLIFAGNYQFSITPKIISASDFENAFDRDYDPDLGTAAGPVKSVEGKNIFVDSDEVYVEGNFVDANASEQAKDVLNLHLGGLDAYNYKLAGNSTTSHIRKAEAKFAINGKSFVYGSITRLNLADSLSISVTSNGKELLRSLYNLQIEVQGATYSSRDFLEVKEGGYDVVISADLSTNYNFETLTGHFEVTPYQLSLNFTQVVLSVEYGSEIWEMLDGNVAFTVPAIMNPLQENVNVSLKVENLSRANKEVGHYRFASSGFSSLNKNYELVSVTDEAPNGGAFEIVKQVFRIYAFIDNEVISTLDDRIKTTTVYDGKEYDNIIIKKNQDDQQARWWLYLQNKSSGAEKPLAPLAFFTLSGENYVRYNGEVTDLSATFSFEKVKNVTPDDKPIYIRTLNATSSSHEVKFGYNVSNYSFILTVQAKKVYFNTSLIQQTFNNKEAIYSYADAKSILTGLIPSEQISLQLTFVDGEGKVAKYYSGASTYEVHAQLIGTTADQYELVLKQNNDFGAQVRGQISRANISLRLMSKKITYGEEYSFNFGTDYDFNFGTLGNFDINAYRETGRVFDFDVKIIFDEDSQLSSTRHLNVGDYTASIIFDNSEKCDFELVDIFLNNENLGSNRTLTQTVLTVNQRELSISQKEGGKSLQEIFTRDYDETLRAEIFDENGNLLFDLENLVSLVQEDGETLFDDVWFADDAQYSDFRGVGLSVNFHLVDDKATGKGKDSKNYVIKPYENGVITAVRIGIEFDFGADEKDDITTSAEGELISALAYPFLDRSAYLTSNSFDPETARTKNFPSSLSGKVGHNFSHWMLSVALDGDSKQQQIEELLELQNSIGLIFDEDLSADSSDAKIVVANDERTVALLKEILKDNLFGLWYQNDGISLVFHAIWLPQEYSLKIQIEDENGESSTHNIGKVTSQEFADVTSAVSFDKFFVYGQKSSLDVSAFAAEHTKFLSFVLNGVEIDISTSQTIEGVCTFVFDKESNMLKISDVSSDLEISAKFRVQRVTIELQIDDDLQDEIEIDSDKFEHFVWIATYYDVENLTFADISGLHLVGRTLVAFIKNGEEENSITSDMFASTLLMDESGADDITISVKPVFEADTINVTLDFGYNDRIETIQVKYGAKYKTATYVDGLPAWQDDVLREGYDFLGWFDGDSKVEGENILLETSKTLRARWQICTYSVSIVLENINFISSQILEGQNNVITAEEVPYESEVVFKIESRAGYSLPQTWDERFNVQSDGTTATISFKMAAENFVATISAVARINMVEFFGDNVDVSAVQIFDVTNDDETTIDFSIDQGRALFHIATGKIFRMEVGALPGFDMTEQVTINTGNPENLDVVISKEINEQGKLILTLSGLTIDISMNFQATERTNTITISFEPSTIKNLYVGSDEYQTPSEPISLEVVTGKEAIFSVEFAHGFDLSSLSLSDAFDDTRISIKQQTQTSESVYRIVLENIYSDAEVVVNAKKRQFTLTLKTVSFAKEDNQPVEESENYAHIVTEGASVASAAVEFGTQVTLTLHNAPSYYFSGWSLDGINAIGDDGWKEYGFVFEDNVWKYVVSDDATFWAIFSQDDYTIVLGTLDFTYIDKNLSNIAEEERYISIPGEYFETNGEKLETFNIFYGQEKTILFNVPDGYMFYGYGFYDEQNFVLLNGELRTDRQVQVKIQTSLFGSTFVRDLYMVVVSYSSTIEVFSEIDFKGVYDEDVDVGAVELSDCDGNPVNEFGYVDGSRTHYAEFEDEQMKNLHNFRFVAYTQNFGYARDEIYLKVANPRAGYYFEGIYINNEKISYEEMAVTSGQYKLFRIFGVVGGMEDISITIRYAPNLNAVELSFIHNGLTAPGGLLEVRQEKDDIVKLWTSGNGYSYIDVSAFTDTKFSVTAYIRAGFFVDASEISLWLEDENQIVDANTWRFEELSITETGFVGKITFDVFGFADVSRIKIILHDRKYTVAFKDGEDVLLKVKHVGFNTDLQDYLSKENEMNIVPGIIQPSFVNGRLDLRRTLKDHNFEGYFTNQNGSGHQYIDSNSNAIGVWLESGYVYDTATGKYNFADNVFVNGDGEIEIPLYVYLSYFKTRISFSIKPNVNTNYTAEDIVSGIDPTNSWFYSSNPNYIEIAFNTDIDVTAPQISGYKFYKFIIKQKAFGETEDRAPVEFFKEKMPWSTNEIDRIVHVDIEIIYFAQLDVHIVGGEGDVELMQTYENQQAKDLLDENFFDTEKELIVTPKIKEGYKFLRWQYLSQVLPVEDDGTNAIKITPNRKASIYLYLEGERATLNFEDYNPSQGQISELEVESMDGSRRVFRNMVGYIDGKYIKNKTTEEVQVGDTITLGVSMRNNIAVQWNRDDIVFKSYDPETQMTYFTFKILGADAKDDGIVRIIPIFTTAERSVYITRFFAEDEIYGRAFDGNNPNNALFAIVNGVAKDNFSVSRGADVELDLLINANYGIKSVTIRSGNVTLTDIGEFLDGNKIVLKEQFMVENNFGGNIFIEIQITRLMWAKYDQKSDSLIGEGTQKNPYHIKNVDDLVLMMKLVNSGAKNENGQEYRECAYVLDADINLETRFWTPIGTSEFSFDGIFDFNRHSVRNISLAILYDQISYNGLFGVLGPHARFIRGVTSWWWWLLITLLVVFLTILLIYLIYRNKKKKKENAEMARR